MSLFFATYTVASLTLFALKFLPLERPVRKVLAYLPFSMRRYFDYLDRRTTTEFSRDVEFATTQKIAHCADRRQALKPCPLLQLEASLDALRIARCRSRMLGIPQKFRVDKDPSRQLFPIFVRCIEPTYSTERDVADLFLSKIDRTVLRDVYWKSYGLAVIPTGHAMEMILLLAHEESATPDYYSVEAVPSGDLGDA